MNRTLTFIASVITFATVAGFGCGGSGTTNPATGSNTNAQVISYSVQVNATGIGDYGGVTLTNTLDNLSYSIKDDGDLTLISGLASGTEYNYEIIATAPELTCSISNASGTIGGASVTITLSCLPKGFYTVSGTVSGLTGSGMRIRLNVNNFTSIEADGPFTFAVPIADGSEYVVRLLEEPEGQVCTVRHGLGRISGNVTNVEIVCVEDNGGDPARDCADGYTLGGTVVGLDEDKTIVISSGGPVEDSYTMVGSGEFTFEEKLCAGETYFINVSSSITIACLFENQAGEMGESNRSDTVITCSNAELGFHTGSWDVVSLSNLALVPTLTGGLAADEENALAISDGDLGTVSDLGLSVDQSGMINDYPNSPDIATSATNLDDPIYYIFGFQNLDDLTSCVLETPLDSIECTAGRDTLYIQRSDVATAMGDTPQTTIHMTVGDGSGDTLTTDAISVTKHGLVQISQFGIANNSISVGESATYNSDLYFVAGSGYELYKYDPNAGSINVISNINNVEGHNDYVGIPAAGDSGLFFRGTNNADHIELFKYNNGEITQISNINYNSMAFIVPYNGKIYFGGLEIYEFDEAGNTIKRLNIGNNYISNVTVHNNKLYFFVRDDWRFPTSTDLYEFDGVDSANTIKKIYVAGSSSFNDHTILSSSDGGLYFSGKDELGEIKLFKYADGIVSQISSVVLSVPDFNKHEIIEHDGDIYFKGTGGIYKYADNVITKVITDTAINLSRFINISLDMTSCGGGVYMNGMISSQPGNPGASYYSKLFRYDPITSELSVVTNIVDDADDQPKGLSCVNDELYFTAFTTSGDAAQRELFKFTDGATLQK